MNELNPNVTKIRMTRNEMGEAIEKAAAESNSDYYICPFCYGRKPKKDAAVHKTTCPDLG